MIRTKVFETNSSSTHSISIISGDPKLYSTISVDEDGTIELTGGQFGWEQMMFTSPIAKANYAIQDVFGNRRSYNDDEDEISFLNFLKDEKLQMIFEVIKEHTKAKNIVINKEELKSGYIDHQSAETSMEAFESKQTLFDFLFNPNSYIHTDNDNH
jgi:hypothetical protein